MIYQNQNYSKRNINIFKDIKRLNQVTSNHMWMIKVYLI